MTCFCGLAHCLLGGPQPSESAVVMRGFPLEQCFMGQITSTYEGQDPDLMSFLYSDIAYLK